MASDKNALHPTTRTFHLAFVKRLFQSIMDWREEAMALFIQTAMGFHYMKLASK
jgi:hypothetical protein